MPLPQTMRAVEIAQPGGPEVLRAVERPVPQPGAGQILIAVDHAGVNRPDALQRAGAYDPPKGASDLPGLECAGTVAATGPGVTRWSVGDHVCALLPGGGYAEYVTTPADHALRIPEGLSMAQAAALPETHFTVWTNVFDRGRLRGGTRPQRSNAVRPLLRPHPSGRRGRDGGRRRCRPPASTSDTPTFLSLQVHDPRLQICKNELY